jgi:hypothetical protein
VLNWPPNDQKTCLHFNYWQILSRFDGVSAAEGLLVHCYRSGFKTGVWQQNRTAHSGYLPIDREFWLIKHIAATFLVFLSIFVSDNFFSAIFAFSILSLIRALPPPTLEINLA